MNEMSNVNSAMKEMSDLNKSVHTNFDDSLKYLITSKGGVKNVNAFFNRLKKLITSLKWMNNEKTMSEIKNKINNVSHNLDLITSVKKIKLIINKIESMEKICKKVIVKSEKTEGLKKHIVEELSLVKEKANSEMKGAEDLEKHIKIISTLLMKKINGEDVSKESLKVKLEDLKSMSPEVESSLKSSFEIDKPFLSLQKRNIIEKIFKEISEEVEVIYSKDKNSNIREKKNIENNTSNVIEKKHNIVKLPPKTLKENLQRDIDFLAETIRKDSKLQENLSKGGVIDPEKGHVSDWTRLNSLLSLDVLDLKNKEISTVQQVEDLGVVMKEIKQMLATGYGSKQEYPENINTAIHNLLESSKNYLLNQGFTIIDKKIPLQDEYRKSQKMDHNKIEDDRDDKGKEETFVREFAPNHEEERLATHVKDEKLEKSQIQKTVQSASRIIETPKEKFQKTFIEFALAIKSYSKLEYFLLTAPYENTHKSQLGQSYENRKMSQLDILNDFFKRDASTFADHQISEMYNEINTILDAAYVKMGVDEEKIPENIKEASKKLSGALKNIYLPINPKTESTGKKIKSEKSNARPSVHSEVKAEAKTKEEQPRTKAGFDRPIRSTRPPTRKEKSVLPSSSQTNNKDEEVVKSAVQSIVSDVKPKEQTIKDLNETLWHHNEEVIKKLEDKNIKFTEKKLKQILRDVEENELKIPSLESGGVNKNFILKREAEFAKIKELVEYKRAILEKRLGPYIENRSKAANLKKEAAESNTTESSTQAPSSSKGETFAKVDVKAFESRPAARKEIKKSLSDLILRMEQDSGFKKKLLEGSTFFKASPMAKAWEELKTEIKNMQQEKHGPQYVNHLIDGTDIRYLGDDKNEGQDKKLGIKQFIENAGIKGLEKDLNNLENLVAGFALTKSKLAQTK